MLKRLSSYAFAGLLGLLLVAGPASAQQPGAMEIRQGVIEQITQMDLPTNHHRGLGAVIGGLGGLGIGSLIGGGTGRDVAMVAGTWAARYSATICRRSMISRSRVNRSSCGSRSGVLVAITQPLDPNLRVGQRVYVEGAGEGARVIAQQ